MTRAWPVSPGTKNAVTWSLKTALARIGAERHRQRARFKPSFEFGDQLALALRFAMHRILKTLHEFLQLGHTGLEGIEPADILARQLGIRCGTADRGTAAHLPDPRDQSLALAHTGAPRSAAWARPGAADSGAVPRRSSCG